MQKILMAVYMMNHPDGSPRKYWCCASSGGKFITRWGAAGARFQEREKPSGDIVEWKVRKEKESKGYAYLGSYLVSDQIHWDQTDQNLNQPPSGQPAKSKFENAILHWTAKKLPGSWQTQVLNVLNELDDVAVQHDGDVVEISVYSKSIKLGSARSTGSITMGDGDWMASLILLRLAKFLPVVVVDDSSNSVDRRILKSSFIKNGYIFMCQGSSLDEFDDFATKLGLMPQLDVATNQAASHFF